VWFLGVFFLARHKKGGSALQFQRDTGVGSYQTARALLHKLRSGLTNLPAPLLKGDVEVDETYIGGHRTGWNGRGAGKEGVAVIVERRGRTAGSARLAVIPRATKEVLTSFVQGAIRPKEAIVHTDAWASYTALSKMGIDHRPRKRGTRTPRRGRAAVGPHHLRKSQDVATGNFPRGQPKTSSALIGRVRVPVRPTLEGSRTLSTRFVLRDRRRALPLSPTDGGAKWIGREIPIRRARLLPRRRPTARLARSARRS
jgi:hypothetical protein